MCFSTEDYNVWMNKHYLKSDDDDDDEKISPKWFYLPYCDEYEEFIGFVDNKCSNYRSHRLLVTCNFCQNDFETFNDRDVGCSVCFRSIERKRKTYTFKKTKKLASVYSKKRRIREYIKDDLVRKVGNYIL